MNNMMCSMSKGLKLGRADTTYAERAYKLSLKNRNWLRHGKSTSAGKIDEMLFDGATIEQIAKRAKMTKGAVYVHLNHLRKVHKLAIVRRDWVFSYDLDSMNGKGKAERKSRRRK
jgi:hypothetical protein